MAKGMQCRSPRHPICDQAMLSVTWPFHNSCTDYFYFPSTSSLTVCSRLLLYTFTFAHATITHSIQLFLTCYMLGPTALLIPNRMLQPHYFQSCIVLYCLHA